MQTKPRRKNKNKTNAKINILQHLSGGSKNLISDHVLLKVTTPMRMAKLDMGLTETAQTAAQSQMPAAQ